MPQAVATAPKCSCGRHHHNGIPTPTNCPDYFRNRNTVLTSGTPVSLTLSQKPAVRHLDENDVRFIEASVSEGGEGFAQPGASQFIDKPDHQWDGNQTVYDMPDGSRSPQEYADNLINDNKLDPWVRNRLVESAKSGVRLDGESLRNNPEKLRLAQAVLEHPQLVGGDYFNRAAQGMRSYLQSKMVDNQAEVDKANAEETQGERLRDRLTELEQGGPFKRLGSYFQRRQLRAQLTAWDERTGGHKGLWPKAERAKLRNESMQKYQGFLDNHVRATNSMLDDDTLDDRQIEGRRSVQREFAYVQRGFNPGGVDFMKHS